MMTRWIAACCAVLMACTSGSTDTGDGEAFTFAEPTAGPAMPPSGLTAMTTVTAMRRRGPTVTIVRRKAAIQRRTV